MASPAPPSEQLLDDVRRFLRVTLNQELLSPTSEKQRQDLLQRLSTREQSPGSYLDMNCCKKSYNAEISRDFQEFYEAFEPDDLKSARRRSDISFLKSSELHNELNINKDNYVTKNVHRKSLNSVLSSELILGSERLQDRKPSSTGSTTGTNMNGINGLNSPNSVASSVKSDSLSSSTSTIPQESDGERGANSSEVLSISASALKYSAIKHGVLARKERVLKAFEKVRKYWVGVLGHSLYIYTSEKDLRPTTVIDILGYSARPVSVKDPPNSSPKKDYTFEIVCPGKKTYQFNYFQLNAVLFDSITREPCRTERNCKYFSSLSTTEGIQVKDTIEQIGAHFGGHYFRLQWLIMRSIFFVFCRPETN